jgi:site-specific recombinase XerD
MQAAAREPSELALRVPVGPQGAILDCWIRPHAERAAESAGLKLKAHAHMLRHACGFKLANDGVDTRALQAYLGHKNIQHTVRYTELAPTRFVLKIRRPQNLTEVAKFA